jgi:glycosyltransferase involved in cell wall biosynthesis
LIVFSHLRWDCVFQRPQHLLSRLARRYRVYFVEEPVFDDGPPRLEHLPAGPNLTVLRAHTDVAEPGFCDRQMDVLRPLLRHFAERESLDDPLVWLYTPMALPLLGELQPSAVIYDCIDDVSQGAPGPMPEREAALFAAADLVLAGGPSLFQAKRALHANLHCVPSSVDAAHFAPERITANCKEYLAAEKLQAHILAPRLGFFGVIDERFDAALIGALARAHPDWHLVMVGPVVRTHALALPQEPNIHWLGLQPYSRLPALVAGWDVCLLPYAMNGRTRFVNPTKTLEYLAAEKPVVSTAVSDVIAMYDDVVHIARTYDDFIRGCERMLVETPQHRAERLVQSAACVSRFSWDEAAATVMSLIEQAIEHRCATGDAEPQQLVASCAARLRSSQAGAGARRLAASSSVGTW